MLYAPASVSLRQLGRTTIVVLLTVGAFALYVMTASSARGAEPGSSLKWKSRSSVTVPSRHLAEPAELPAPSQEVRLVSYYDANLKPAQAVDDPLKTPFKEDSQLPKSPGLNNSLQLPPAAPGTLPTIPPSEQFAVGGGFEQEPCPELSEFKKIGAISNRIAASPGDLPKECIIDDRIEYPTNHPWSQTVFTWKASGMCHKPLYFEEVALERYGHSTGPLSQPFVSAAHFFGTLPLLPYQMGMDPPGECKYALGYYRPGSCAPYIIGGVPISARGIAAETAAVLGMVYILP